MKSLFRMDFGVNGAVRVLLTFMFTVGVGAGLYAPIFAVFVEDFVTPSTLRTVGFAMAIYALAKSVVQIPLARYLDLEDGERDDFYMLVGGATLGSIYCFTIPFIRSPLELYMLQSLGGVADALLMASYYALFSHHIDKGHDGFEWSLLSVGGLTFSYAIGGAYGGVVADLYGFKTLFFMSGVINIIGCIVTIFLYPYIDRGAKDPTMK